MGVDRGSRSAGGKATTPELVLVDPELRARALAALRLSPPVAERALPEPTEPPQIGVPKFGLPVDDRSAGRPRERSASRVERRHCLVPSILSALTGALLVALAVSFKGPPGYYLPPVTTSDSDAAAGTQAVPEGGRGSVPASGSVVLEWDEQPNAIGYEVTVRRGERTVLRAFSLEARYPLEPGWVYGGVRYRRDAGLYRLTVRPIVQNGSATGNTVERTVVVPGVSR